MIVAQIQTLYQFWIHTRFIEKMPTWFEFVFNTPSHHRVHHGVNPKYIDKNHGGTFIFYDRIFGTFQREEEKVYYGTTSQLKSWNIAVANFDYYGWVASQLSKVKNIKDFFLVMIKAPGWRPDYLGGPIVPKEIDTSRALYDADIFPQMHVYIITQFVTLLAFVAYFLFSIEKFDIYQEIVSVCFIILSTISIGTLFEAKKWSKMLEFIRLLLAIPLLFYLAGGIA